MKILILTAYVSRNPVSDPAYRTRSTYKLYEYLLSRGHELTLTRYSDLSIHLGVESRMLVDNQNLLEFDLIIFRPPFHLKMQIYHGEIAQVVAQYCMSHRKLAINGRHLATFGHDFNKLFQMYYLSTHSLPIPATIYIKESYLYRDLQFPLVAKPLRGTQGDRVGVVAKVSDIPDGELLFQEILPNRTDYRVLVVKGLCLGAMQRQATGTSFVSNYSAGGAVEKAELTLDMQTLALECSRLFCLDFCGVDLMRAADGSLRVLEVNRFPEFIGFQKALGIDVPAQIADAFVL